MSMLKLEELRKAHDKYLELGLKEMAERCKQEMSEELQRTKFKVELNQRVDLDGRRTMSGDNKTLAPNDAYYHQSDTIPQCPHCNDSRSVTFLGELIVDGCSRPTLVCGACNKVFSNVPSGIKVLMDEALSLGANNVGFRMQDVHHISRTNESPNTYNTDTRLDQVNVNLNNLTMIMQDLVAQIQTLASQNHQLMEQLATDPLIGVRKAVNEFNLK